MAFWSLNTSTFISCFMDCNFKLFTICQIMLYPVNSHRRDGSKLRKCVHVLICVGGCFVDACTSACICVCVRVRKRIHERVCGIPTAEQIRKVTPNSQSGAELSIKGNL